MGAIFSLRWSEEGVDESFPSLAGSFHVERQQLPVKLLVLVAGQYYKDNKRINFIS